MLLNKTSSITFQPVAPYSYELSLRKPAGWWWSTPDEKYAKGTLWTATRFNGKMVGVKLTSRGFTAKPEMNCTVYSRAKLVSAEREGIERMLRRALKIDEDLSDFYIMAAHDSILHDVVADLYGMRTVSWPELFPALILAVTLQMAPMKRSNQMMDLILQIYGDTVHFNRKTVKYWPSTKRIASADVAELQARARLGYRAHNLVEIAKTLETSMLTMDELYSMEPEEAKKQLLALMGIGEYSAELVMPGMGFPLDVWSSKIFSVLFRGKVPEDPRAAVSMLKEEATKRWGRWAGYAFVYVLNDLPLLSKRVGADLTRF